MGDDKLTPRESRVQAGWTLAALLALGGTVALGQTRAVLVRTQPEYPLVAVKMRVSGTVTVSAMVNPEGTVAEAHAIAGHPLLRPAAERAVLRWKFASAPKTSDTSVDIQFQLSATPPR